MFEKFLSHAWNECCSAGGPLW